MSRIPPEERFDRHEKSAVSHELLRAAVARLGLASHGGGVRKLAGGFQNANYLVGEGPGGVVLRFFSEGPNVARREAGILRLLKGHGVKAPELLDSFELDGRGALALGFVEGELLQDKLPGVDSALFRDLGRELGRIHTIEFPQEGFFGDDAQVEESCENFPDFAEAFLDGILGSIPAARLPEEARGQIRELLDSEWPLVYMTGSSRRLVHCDFNPKNLLVDEDRLAAVLDWEFALSGDGYVDLGNFFRFPEDYPPGAEAEFIAGYEEFHGKLEPRWRDMARLYDLTAMVSLLSRPEEYPRTFRTARTVIDQTLEHFGY